MRGWFLPETRTRPCSVRTILVKLHLRDRAHAVATARDAGLGTGSHPPHRQA